MGFTEFGINDKPTKPATQLRLDPSKCRWLNTLHDPWHGTVRGLKPWLALHWAAKQLEHIESMPRGL